MLNLYLIIYVYHQIRQHNLYVSKKHFSINPQFHLVYIIVIGISVTHGMYFYLILACFIFQKLLGVYFTYRTDEKSR